MSRAIEIRRLDGSNKDDLRETAALLADAFTDNPLFLSAFPREAARRRLLRTLFRALVEDTARFGGAHLACNEKIIGALLWYGPGAYPMTARRILRQLPRFLTVAALGGRGLTELRDAQRQFDSRRPVEPHCHASFLAGRDGERIGPPLALALMREADEKGWPIYLETQNPRSLSLYLRMGCELLADGFSSVHGGPLTWTLWRPPGARRNIGRAAATAFARAAE